MVLAYHVIFGASYGFWLPNDPRGAWTDMVWAWELRRFGPATKTTARRSIAAVPHDAELRMTAKEALKYPAVQLTGGQAASIGAGFREATAKSGYRIYACSILPEHVHMVIGRHRYSVEQVVRVLKQGATQSLVSARLHPLAEFARNSGGVPSPWQQKCWHVFLDDLAGVERAVKYVENNPVKERRERQRWSFVEPWNTVDLRSTAKRVVAGAR